MNYGEKISHLRKSKGMTQEDLGKVLNVTYQAVSKWERGESLPDFNMMSQIAKFFQVPLGYFEDGGENLPTAAPAEQPAVAATDNLVGACTECGKMLKEEDVFTYTPKIVCKSCAERLKKEEENKKAAEELHRKSVAVASVKEQLGSGLDVKFIICIVLVVAVYVTLTVFCFLNKTDRDFIAALLVLVPLAVFACPYVIFEFIDDLRDKDDGPEGYKLSLSLITGGAFSVVNIIIYLVLYFTLGKNGLYLGLLGIGTVVSFTFISQYMWGSCVKDIFTCGGFTFKLPGVIFSLTPESIIMMIIVKVFLGIIAILVFIATTVLFAIVAMLGSVFTFIPCIIYKVVKDRKARAELKD